MLAFLYTRELVLPGDGDGGARTSQLIVDVFELSHRLLLEPLARKVEAMLVAEMIDADNACALLLLAEQFQSLFLREECFDFVIDRRDAQASPSR